MSMRLCGGEGGWSYSQWVSNNNSMVTVVHCNDDGGGGDIILQVAECL